MITVPIQLVFKPIRIIIIKKHLTLVILWHIHNVNRIVDNGEIFSTGIAINLASSETYLNNLLHICEPVFQRVFFLLGAVFLLYAFINHGSGGYAGHPTKYNSTITSYNTLVLWWGYWKINMIKRKDLTKVVLNIFSFFFMNSIMWCFVRGFLLLIINGINYPSIASTLQVAKCSWLSLVSWVWVWVWVSVFHSLKTTLCEIIK